MLDVLEWFSKVLSWYRSPTFLLLQASGGQVVGERKNREKENNKAQKKRAHIEQVLRKTA